MGALDSPHSALRPTCLIVAPRLQLACPQAKKEAELRELAMKARLERGGGLANRMDPSGEPGTGGQQGQGAMSDDEPSEDLPPPPPR